MGWTAAVAEFCVGVWWCCLWVAWAVSVAWEVWGTNTPRAPAPSILVYEEDVAQFFEGLSPETQWWLARQSLP